MLRFTIIILAIAFQITLVENILISSKDVISIMKYFQLSHPIIYNEILNMKEKMELFKEFSYKSYLTSFNYNSNFHQLHQTIIAFPKGNIQKFKWEIKTTAPIFVFTKVNNEMDLHQMNISIDTEMYFIDGFSMKMYESYMVNNVSIRRYLGQFIRSQRNVKNVQIRFIKSENNYDLSMIRRRGSNFHGIQFKCMVELEPPMTYIPKDFVKTAQYFPNNDTYDLTGMVEGYFMKMLRQMEKTHNFTTKLYKRKDGSWGWPTKLPNGTIVLSGMIKDLWEGTADFAWVPFAIDLRRIPYVDFMPIIDRGHSGIFIRNQNDQEFHWNLFLEMFSTELWCTIFMAALIISFTIFAMEFVWANPVCISQYIFIFMYL